MTRSADEPAVLIPPCFRTKLFNINQNFLNSFNIFEDQFEILPQSEHPNDNLDVYREIMDDSLKALTCISNTFQPNIASEDLRRNIEAAEDCLKKATLSCYKHSIAAFKVDLDAVYYDTQTSPCLIDISHNDFRLDYQTFRSTWLHARELDRKNEDAIPAYTEATLKGIKLKKLIDLPTLEDIMKEKAKTNNGESSITYYT